MNSFSISQLQDYSGIKAHTIRIWEQRYNALTPQRSEGNTRYYDGEQLRRLLNIVSLLGKEHKISKLCALCNQELKTLLDKQFEDSTEAPGEHNALFVSQLISAAFDFDQERFEKIFSSCTAVLGLCETYIKILYPVLQRMGMLWSKDALPPAHEHFITHLIRGKILTAIDALPKAENTKNSWLLFLPEDEFHEIGLLMSYFIIRNAGHMVYYLGANVPISSLAKTVDSIQPSNLLCFLVSKKDKQKAFSDLSELNNQLQSANMYVSCNPEGQTNEKLANELTTLHSVSDLEELL